MVSRCYKSGVFRHMTPCSLQKHAASIVRTVETQRIVRRRAYHRERWGYEPYTRTSCSSPAERWLVLTPFIGLVAHRAVCNWSGYANWKILWPHRESNQQSDLTAYSIVPQPTMIPYALDHQGRKSIQNNLYGVTFQNTIISRATSLGPVHTISCKVLWKR
jgi:hypothetical protein